MESVTLASSRHCVSFVSVVMRVLLLLQMI